MKSRTCSHTGPHYITGILRDLGFKQNNIDQIVTSISHLTLHINIDAYLYIFLVLIYAFSAATLLLPFPLPVSSGSVLSATLNAIWLDSAAASAILSI